MSLLKSINIRYIDDETFAVHLRMATTSWRLYCLCYFSFVKEKLEDLQFLFMMPFATNFAMPTLKTGSRKSLYRMASIISVLRQ